MNPDQLPPAEPVDDLPSLDALGRTFAAAAAAEARGRRGAQRSSLPRFAAIGLCAIALLGLGSLTPPGRAVAEQVGDLVGIGKPEIDGQSFTVLLDRDRVDGRGYEVEASGDFQPGETCIFLNFKAIGGDQMGSCLAGDTPEVVRREKVAPFIYRATPGLFGDGTIVVQMLASLDVDRVELQYRRTDGSPGSVDASGSALDPSLTDDIGVGSNQATRFFFAVLPASLPADLRNLDRDAETDSLLSSLVISTYDAAGNQLSSRRMSAPREGESRLDRGSLFRLRKDRPAG